MATIPDEIFELISLMLVPKGPIISNTPSEPMMAYVANVYMRYSFSMS